MSDVLQQVDIKLKLDEKEAIHSSQKIQTPEDAVRILADIFKELDREEIGVVNLDGANHPVNFNIISVGNTTSAIATPSDLYKAALLSNASSILILHNHPSSEVKASSEDLITTRRLVEAGNILGVRVLDHIIVGGRTGETYSILEHHPTLFRNEQQHKVAEEIYGNDVRERKERYGSLNTYEILQLKQDSSIPYRFMGMDQVRKNGYVISNADYEKTYEGELQSGDDLESLYMKFNLYRPEDFTGHSLSVSDVIVLHLPEGDKAYYVDSIGFQEVPHLVQEQSRQQSLEEPESIKEFRSLTDKYMRPIMELSAEQMESLVKEYVEAKVQKHQIPVQIKGIAVYGSRSRGSEREDSDLDVVVEYDGDYREDSLFNILHEDNFRIGDIPVDINPITGVKTGTLAEFLGRADLYMNQEQAFRIGNRYLMIQEATEGYEYTIMGMDFQEIDGGIYDNDEISIWQAAEEIIDDLVQNPDYNGVKGNITPEMPIQPMNVEMLEERIRKEHERATFYVTECGEFPSMGKTYENMEDVKVALFRLTYFQKQSPQMIPGLGIRMGEDMDSMELEVVRGQCIDLEMLEYVPDMANDTKVQKMIASLMVERPDFEVRGNISMGIHVEKIILQTDRKHVLSDDEKSMIREYASVVKEPDKVELLISQLVCELEIGNGNPAPILIAARDEMDKLQNRPDAEIRTSDMQAYGYDDEGMLPMGREKALEYFEKDKPVFLLYPDNSEALTESREQIEKFDGLFGMEKTVWDMIQEEKPERRHNGTTKTR